ncbi:peptidylprolyl isomerase [Comamonas odontotermitis]|uniref:peptidylprolyl isomerase n=1 Tax=Comamonas odontotermitis TaxID=379895 RepID=UPI003752CFCA
MRNWLKSVGMVVALGGMSVVAVAQGSSNAVLLQGPSTAVYESDVLNDAKRMPEEMRSSFLAKPESVAQMVEALYVRRAIAETARSSGLADQPEIAAAIKIAIDKVLSDAYLQKFNAEHKPDTKLAEAQAKAAYAAKKETFKAPEQVHIAHILVMSKDDDDAAAKAKAEKLLAEAQAGADFAQLAKDNSSDASSAVKGGDLGMVSHGRMVPEFETAAFALDKPNQLSPVIKTQFGYHIIKLFEKKPARTMSFEEVRPDLEKQYVQQSLQTARQAEVAKVLKAATWDKANMEAFSARFADKK